MVTRGSGVFDVPTESLLLAGVVVAGGGPPEILMADVEVDGAVVVEDRDNEEKFRDGEEDPAGLAKYFGERRPIEKRTHRTHFKKRPKKDF